MPDSYDPPRTPDYVLGRVEARVDGVGSRIDRLETTTAARLLGIEGKLETIITTLATRAGGLSMVGAVGRWAQWGWLAAFGAVTWAIGHWHIFDTAGGAH